MAYTASLADCDGMLRPCDGAVPAAIWLEVLDAFPADVELAYTASVTKLDGVLKPCDAAVPNADDSMELLIVLEAVTGPTLADDVEF